MKLTLKLLTLFLAVLCSTPRVVIYNKLSPIIESEEKSKTPNEKEKKVIIGVLTLPLSTVLRNKMAKQLIDNRIINSHEDMLSYFMDASYFPSSYSKWLKERGADVLPIDINDDLYSILEAVEAVDGLLLTGGAVPIYLHEKSFENEDDFSSVMELRQPSFYTRIIKEIIKLIKTINDKKQRVYPIWATCLGFESLVLNESSLDISLDRVHNENYNSPLELKPNADIEQTRFYQYFAKSPNAFSQMTGGNPFFFNHENGFIESHFARNEYLRNNYHVIATATTKHKTNQRIVAVIENKHYPIFGVQFHPEKNKYEHHASVIANREQETLELCDQMANMFLSQIKKGRNRKMLQLQNWILQERSMRYTLYVETNVGVFDEIYFFKKNGAN